MKKILIIGSLILASATTIANAKPATCPFTDYFVVNAPAGATITSLSTTGNLYASVTGPTNFVTFCKDNTIETGIATVIVSENSTDVCTLDIQDGPYMMNPVVNHFICSGNLRYDRIDH